MLDLINDFYLGCLDIKILNYEVITLIPKTKDANNVKQFRPIYLLNVSFEIFTKLLMDRLTPMAHKIVSNNQIAFIKGRYILDCATILHETLHELNCRKMKGVVMKIDFEKVMTTLSGSLWKVFYIEKALTREWWIGS